MKTTLETSGEDVKTTLETSGEDVKTTLETSVPVDLSSFLTEQAPTVSKIDKDTCKTTLETSEEDVKIHSRRVEKM